VVRHVCSRSLEALHATVARRNMRSGSWQINPHTEADQECSHSKFSQNATVAFGHDKTSPWPLAAVDRRRCLYFTEFLNSPPDA
jgi:hypothetical protein